MILVALWLASSSIPAYSFGANNAPKSPSAAAILDRYVQATGGLDLYRRYAFVSIYSTVTRADQSTFNTTVFHSRDGRVQTEIDAGPESRESGVSSGIVWEFSETKGTRILSGKVAERRLAEARGFDEDDWRERFPTVKYLGSQVVNGKSCYHLKLARADGSVAERFYDKRSSLLVREISTEFNDTGVEQPVTTDIDEYDTSLGVMHPSLMHVKAGDGAFTIRIDNVTYSRGQAQPFEIPHEVERAAAEHRRGGSLPNPVDLIDKFIETTGGKDAYRAITTEVIKADFAIKSQNLQFPVVIYTAKGKTYTSLDIPSLGKFEFGSDGQTAWQRSVVPGPRLQPQSNLGGLVGPVPGDVLGWTEGNLNLETVSKEEVNGSPCYQIKIGVQQQNDPANTACFDVQTGYLVRTAAATKQQANVITVESIFSDYQSQNGFKTPYHIETKVAGQLVSVDLKEIVINGPLPDGIFDLPADVRALKEKRLADRSKAGESHETAPVIKNK